MSALAAPGGATSELTQLALNLAHNCGYAVFPCGANKAPAIGKDEDGGRGLLDASTNPGRIIQLFGHRNAALIGVTCGAPSGISVLDVDAGAWAEDAAPKVIEKHQAARAWWHANADRLPSTRIYQSRSGGLHVVFRHHPELGTSQSIISQGVDTRGDGGYVIWWFAHGCECLDGSVPAECPQWLLHALKPKPQPRPVGQRRFGRADIAPGANTVIDRAFRIVDDARDGSKHTSVRQAAKLLGGVQAAARFSDQWAEDEIRKRLPDSVKNWKNVEKTVAYGLKWGRSRPLQTRAEA